MILRARVALPIRQAPISNAGIVLAGGRIAQIGRWRELRPSLREQALDLGEVVVLPGLINAHCHLDYTHMAGQLPPPRNFSDWLKLILSTKAGWNSADYAESWQRGAKMLVRTGTTSVADIEAVPELLPKMWVTTPLRVFSFLEMIGITNRRTPDSLLEQTLEKLRALDQPQHPPGLSPHAPYSTLPELLRLSGRAAQQLDLRLAVHVAESAPEYEMFCEGKGSMYEWLQRSGREMSDCGQGSPVQHLAACGLLSERLMAVHANYLCRGDTALLARHQVHVVHCPRSHLYFRHAPFPLRRLHRAGINVCLGTDSLASVYQGRHQTAELNMFEEMRALAASACWFSPKNILRLVTLNGARALGQARRLGELSPGALADLIAVPFAGKLGDVHESVLHHRGEVAASMIGGHWAITPRESTAT